MFGQGLAFLHQDFYLLASLDNFVHISEGLFFEVAELLPQAGQLVDFCFVVVLSHPVLQDGFEVLKRVADCLVPLSVVISGEEGLLDLFEEVGGDAGLVLLKKSDTADSTITRKTKPSLTKV